MAGSDVKTKRLTATGDASIGRSRVRQVLVTTAGSGTPELKITDGSASGTVVLHCDLLTSEVDIISFPDEGFLVTDDVHIATIDDITSITVFFN